MDINDSLNKGIPISEPVILDKTDIANNVQNKEKMEDMLNESIVKYHNFILSQSQILFGLEFNGAIAIVTDFTTLKRKIEFSVHAFYDSLKRNLNMSLSTDDFASDEEYRESLIKQANKKIEALKRIKTPAELQRKFPVLHRRYLSCVQEYYLVKKNIIEPLNKLDPITRTKKMFQLNMDLEQKNPFYNPKNNIVAIIDYTNSFSLKTFIASCVIAIPNIINNRDKIVNYIHNNPIDFSFLDDADKDKLELYFAYCNLKQANNADSKYKQDYLYYVSNYFKEHKDTTDDISIIVGASDGKTIQSGILTTICQEVSTGIIITPKILYELYRKVLIENPNLKIIDFSSFDFTGMNLDEVSAFTNEYLKDLEVNWELLPPDDKTFEEDIIRHLKESSKNLKDETTEEHEKRLLELFMKKKNLYDSTNPLFRIMGKNTFNGYIGYVYPNGRVVLDRFYDKQNDSTLADGNAVYAMNIEEFYELSKLSKSELIRSKLCRRYIHKGNWTSKVLKKEIKLNVYDKKSVNVRSLLKKDSDKK